MFANFDLTFWANLAAIGAFFVTLVGAVVGVYGYCAYRCSWNAKTQALVNYLKSQKESATGGKKGQQTIAHLIRHVSLTEDEILKISFESKHIQNAVGQDEDGRAATLFFEYKD